MESFEFYRELYESEWARREQISSSAAVSVGVLSIIAGILAFAAERVDFWQPRTGLVLIVTFVLASACFARAVWLIVRSYHGHSYRRLAYAQGLRHWELQIRDVYKKAGRLAEAWPRFASEMNEKLAEAADLNGRLNVRRSELLFLANRWVIYAFVGAMLTGSAAVLNVRWQPPEIPTVRVVSVP